MSKLIALAALSTAGVLTGLGGTAEAAAAASATGTVKGFATSYTSPSNQSMAVRSAGGPPGRDSLLSGGSGAERKPIVVHHQCRWSVGIRPPRPDRPAGRSAALLSGQCRAGGAPLARYVVHPAGVLDGKN